MPRTQEEAKGAKVQLEARQTWWTKERKALVTKNKYGQQWQTGAAKNGKPNKGKAKAMAQQWQQQNSADEWIDEQGTKNGDLFESKFITEYGHKDARFHQCEPHLVVQILNQTETITEGDRGT